MRLPPSKSIANRALLLASLVGGECALGGLPPGRLPDDVSAMLASLRALGVSALHGDGGRLRVQAPPSLSPAAPLDVGAAGTALRFLLPLAALHCRAPVSFIGAGGLFARPLAPMLDALAACGAGWEPRAGGGLLLPPASGPGSVEVRVDASLSSQFVSGLAMAAAGLPGGGTVGWKGPLASRGYLALTRSVAEVFRCPMIIQENYIVVPGGALRPAALEIPGDWSAAAPFFCAAAALGARVVASPLLADDGQPDMAVLEILGRCGSAWTFRDGACVFDGRLERGIDADLSGCPDLGPVLAATAAAAPARSELRGLATLPHKESDRLAGMVRLVEWAGGRAEALPGPAMGIWPADGAKARTRPAPFDPMGDHRMAFAAAIGALINGGEVSDAACVAKSYPSFWEDWEEFLSMRPH